MIKQAWSIIDSLYGSKPPEKEHHFLAGNSRKSRAGKKDYPMIWLVLPVHRESVIERLRMTLTAKAKRVISVFPFFLSVLSGLRFA